MPVGAVDGVAGLRGVGVGVGRGVVKRSSGDSEEGLLCDVVVLWGEGVVVSDAEGLRPLRVS